MAIEKLKLIWMLDMKYIWMVISMFDMNLIWMLDMNDFFKVVYLIIRYEFMTLVIVCIHFIHL
jgi:hypothetical protein